MPLLPDTLFGIDSGTIVAVGTAIGAAGLKIYDRYFASKKFDTKRDIALDRINLEEARQLRKELRIELARAKRDNRDLIKERDVLRHRVTDVESAYDTLKITTDELLEKFRRCVCRLTQNQIPTVETVKALPPPA